MFEVISAELKCIVNSALCTHHSSLNFGARKALELCA